MSNELSREIFFQSIEIIINSAKSLILDEWDGVIYSVSDTDLVKNASFREYTSEFQLDNLNDGKIYLSMDKITIESLALKLYGMDITGSDELVQDSINELLNFFIGNAARELEKLGVDFIESLIPVASHFEDFRHSYDNYRVNIPTEIGDVEILYSIKKVL